MTQFLLPKVRKRPRRQKPNDDAFRAWIQTLPSCLSGRFTGYPNGEGRNIACHVRRSGRSGTGFKPLFSCIPMTDEEHRYSHQYGEFACIGYFMSPAEQARVFGSRLHLLAAKDWFDQQAAKYREEWLRVHPEDRT